MAGEACRFLHFFLAGEALTSFSLGLSSSLCRQRCYMLCGHKQYRGLSDTRELSSSSLGRGPWTSPSYKNLFRVLVKTHQTVSVPDLCLQPLAASACSQRSLPSVSLLQNSFVVTKFNNILSFVVTEFNNIPGC